jgi:shikimate kinase
MILKLKRTPALYLVGFMACGKTTVGQLLAERLGWKFADLDVDIEEQEHATIPEIFDQRGEAEFRRAETEALRRRVRMVQKGTATVLALGGGAFAQETNFELVAEHGVSLWLDCPLETLRARAAQEGHRPLARDPVKFDVLYHERRPAYARADYRIDETGKTPDEIVEEILGLPLF